MIQNFEILLRKLTPTQRSIGETMVFVIQNPHQASYFVKAIVKEVDQAAFETCFTLLLLISDIVNNAVRGSNWPI